MSDEAKKPDKVFEEFKKSLGKDISYRTERIAIYNSFRQKKDETAAELDLRLSTLIEECKLPGAVKDFLKTDIFISTINYYEVKKWAANRKKIEQIQSPTRKLWTSAKNIKQLSETTYLWQMTIPNCKQHISKEQPA